MSRPQEIDAFIAVGANIEPEAHILRALDLLRGSMPVVATSTFYRTASLGRQEQAPYLNGMWRVRTRLAPRSLKVSVLRDIEARLGRVRARDKFAARPIDLDVALYGDQVVHEPDLHIPDPDIQRRPFLAVPLLELAPELVLPDSGQRLADLPVARAAADMTPADEFSQQLQRRLMT